MSSVWKRPTSSPRQQELAWRNLIFQSHDQFCHCEDVDLHFILLMNKFGNAPKPESEIKNIKWLITGKPDIPEEDTTEKDDPGFLDGELEMLFNENTGDAKEKEEPTTR